MSKKFNESKIDDEDINNVLLTESSVKTKPIIIKKLVSNSDSLFKNISEHLLNKISVLRDDILKYKYPINHLLAHKIKDINDVDRMLKPSQFTLKNNTKYLKELKLDLYQKSEKETINFPKIKVRCPTHYERDKFKLYEKISLNSTNSGSFTTTPNNAINENILIEYKPLKFFNPSVTKIQGFTIKSLPTSDLRRESPNLTDKIKLTLTKLTKSKCNFNTTLITQKKDEFLPNENNKLSIKKIDFTNEIQLKFNKKTKKSKGKIRIIKPIHKKRSSNSTEINGSNKLNKLNLEELGERSMILAKMLNAKKAKKIKFERFSEIKYKNMISDFKRSKFLDDNTPKDII